MPESPPFSLYNYRVDFETQEEESTLASGFTGHPFMDDNIWSSKEQNMVAAQNMFGNANLNKASNEHAMENGNSLAADAGEQGGLVPHIPFDGDAIRAVMHYATVPTSSSSLDSHWVDFQIQMRAYDEERSMNSNTLAVYPHEQGSLIPYPHLYVGTSEEERSMNSNTLGVVPHEQGSLIPFMPINVGVFQEERSMNSNTLGVVPHEQGGLIPFLPIYAGGSEEERSSNTLGVVPHEQRSLIPFLPIYAGAPKEERSMSSNTLGVVPHEQRGLIPYPSLYAGSFDEARSMSSNTLSVVPYEQRGLIPYPGVSEEERSMNNNTLGVVAHEQGALIPYTPVCACASDDEVRVSSSRDFKRAKNNSKRTRDGVVIIDVESEEQMNAVAPSSRKKHCITPTGQTIIDCDLNASLEGYSGMIEANVETVEQPLLALAPLQAEPVFSCPICMCSMEEPFSTKCGHIFCKACLKAAITVQKKCPTCRTKVATMRSTHKVFFPMSS